MASSVHIVKKKEIQSWVRKPERDEPLCENWEYNVKVSV